MQIQFSSLAQAKAVYDVVEHRVLSVRTNRPLPEAELEEVMELVAFLHRLKRLIQQEAGE